MFSLRRVGVAMGRMDRWRVNLLGRFELRAPDGQEVALGARKSIALLALLAPAPGQRVSRDRVAVLLWEDMPDAQARGNLRQLLAATRRPAPFLEADTGSIGFSAGMVETDLAAFGAAIAEDTPAALERAAGLYRADLLDGFSLRDRDFGEWLTGERERLRACRATFPALDGTSRSNRGRAGDPLGAAHSCGRPGTRAGASGADGTLCRSGPACRRSSAIRAAARDARARARHSAGAGDRWARPPDPR